jgi:hypothetical protein
MQSELNDQPAEGTAKRCPLCNDLLQTMLLLNVMPDGYVCPRCELYFSDELIPLARFI